MFVKKYNVYNEETAVTTFIKDRTTRKNKIRLQVTQ